MPSWRTHLEICRRALGVENCDEGLKVLDELIDSPGLHDVGRRDLRRGPVKFASLLVKCCLRFEGPLDGSRHRGTGLESLRERLARDVVDVDSFLAGVAEESSQLITSMQWSSSPVVEKAVRLFGIAAHIYIREFAERRSEEEKLVLAWYLSQPEKLPVQGKALSYAILHHVVDLAAEYVVREQSRDGVAYVVLNRVEKNESLRGLVERLDLLIVGVNAGEREVNPPSELLRQIMVALRRRAWEVYTMLARDRASKGVWPGSKAVSDEIRDLVKELRLLRGLHGYVAVNGEALANAINRALGLLKRGQEVRVEFYDRGSDSLEVLCGRVRPVLVLTARSVEELRRELCSELFRDNAWLAIGLPQLGQLIEYCEALR